MGVGVVGAATPLAPFTGSMEFMPVAPCDFSLDIFFSRFGRQGAACGPLGCRCQRRWIDSCFVDFD